MWDEITYPFLNFNGCTVEVQERISNLKPHFTGHVISYPCWDQSETMLVKEAQCDHGVLWYYQDHTVSTYATITGSRCVWVPGGGGGGGGGGGALRVNISRGARLEVQNGTQQDLNEIIDLVNFGGKKIVYMLKMGGFEMGPNKIWIKW